MNDLRLSATVKATFSLALSALQASLDLTAFKCAFIQQLNMAGHWNPSQPAKNMIVQLDNFLKKSNLSGDSCPSLSGIS